MTLATEPAGTPVTAIFTVEGEGARDVGALRLYVNNMPVGCAQMIVPSPEKTESELRAVSFAVPADALRDGNNTLILRNTGSLFTVIGLDVEVG